MTVQKKLAQNRLTLLQLAEKLIKHCPRFGSVTKNVTKTGYFWGILGHSRASWGHENTMI